MVLQLRPRGISHQIDVHQATGARHQLRSKLGTTKFRRRIHRPCSSPSQLQMGLHQAFHWNRLQADRGRFGRQQAANNIVKCSEVICI
ncbi:hypothetical protein L207DRAFT_106354 [Hyaloscypha variabilis F]|uniref:Uncharacterized protein n=1 Tax=Hyaloscypha variabilis (strain UAMH 11265 / GT02V1 / F) TaxID=1149755 RepID=A0A2J6RCX7_HYAVF|nr:hypothetical protein L207DRAFT_106354 [Hyaloscypha variabilis F]